MEQRLQAFTGQTTKQEIASQVHAPRASRGEAVRPGGDLHVHTRRAARGLSFSLGSP